MKARQKNFRRRMRFEQLEARRVFHGADLFDVGEGEAGQVVDDFSLTDVNPTSATFDEPLSPRDFLDQATGWYWGHAT